MRGLAYKETVRQYAEARIRFASLVNKMMKDDEFQFELSILIEHYPCHLPSYLELLELFECQKDTLSYSYMKSLAEKKFFEFFKNRSLFVDIVKNSDYEELLSLERLLLRFRNNLYRKPSALWHMLHCQRLVQERSSLTSPKEIGVHLTKIQQEIPTGAMSDELSNHDHLWMASTRRQRNIPYHRHTQTILLRSVANKESPLPVAVDGPHESRRTPLADFFEHSLSFAENFAYQNSFCLGKVALVRLAPNGIAYRHSDHEVNLKNRTRYHLVINSSGNNILVLGTEIAYVKQGEFWKYDNKTMHKSYNDSNTWRTHMIFDVSPSEQSSMKISQ